MFVAERWFKMSEQCKVLGGPVQPLNCHGCATKECEFRERQLELVFTSARISAKKKNWSTSARIPL